MTCTAERPSQSVGSYLPRSAEVIHDDVTVADVLVIRDMVI
jgi:hypothetical protein